LYYPTPGPSLLIGFIRLLCEKTIERFGEGSYNVIYMLLDMKPY